MRAESGSILGRSAVERVIADRDMMLRQAEERARAAEARAEQLRRELEAARGQERDEASPGGASGERPRGAARGLDERGKGLAGAGGTTRPAAKPTSERDGDAVVEALRETRRRIHALASADEPRSRHSPGPGHADADDAAPENLVEEIRSILANVEESSRRMLEEARAEGLGHRRQALEAWSEIERENEARRRWHEELKLTIGETQVAITESRTRLEELASRFASETGRVGRILDSLASSLTGPLAPEPIPEQLADDDLRSYREAARPEPD